MCFLGIPFVSHYSTQPTLTASLIMGCSSPPHPNAADPGPSARPGTEQMLNNLCRTKDSQNGARSGVKEGWVPATLPFSAWAHSPGAYNPNP